MTKKGKTQGRVGLWIISGAMALTACGAPKSRWRTSAPASQDQTGVVVRLEPSSALVQIENLIQENETVEARAINPAHGLYEIYNLSEEDVQVALQTKETFSNIYVDHVIPPVHTQSVDLQKCQRNPLAPVAVVEPTLLKEKLNKGTIELKDGRVSFSASRSKSRNPASAQLEYLWVISGPPGSAVEMSMINGPDLSFVPDMPGAYLVQMVAQDASQYCGADALEFGVTVNEPFLGAAAARAYDPNADAAKFHHLSEVGAQTAWSKSKGAGVTIAILDTGVNYNHPDLRANILVNSKEVAGNGLDDDQNGFVDDVLGWDFHGQDAFPQDDNMHGTHVAGLAASAVTGVAPMAKVISVKVLGAVGGGDIAGIIAGIYYASDRGANIINMSLGMDSFGMDEVQKQAVHKAFKKAIDYAASKNVTLAIAAGNGDPVQGIGFDIDKSPVYPASVASPNLVAVASIDSQGALTDYSNFGMMAVGLAAPGGTGAKPLMAPYYFPSKAAYIGLSGTSMATPVVAGALALVKSANRALTPEQQIKSLTLFGSSKPQLKGKIRSGNSVNAAMAVGRPLPVPRPPTPTTWERFVAWLGL